MNKSPTEKQLEFANAIGVDVSPGMSRSEVSSCLKGALEVSRVERNVHVALSNELAARAGLRPIPEWRIEAVNAHRESGVKTGCIVDISGRTAVMTGSSPRDRLQLYAVTLEGYRLRSCSSRNAKVLYTPPAGFVHEVHAASASMRQIDWSTRKGMFTAFLDFVRPRLAAEEKFKNQHGEFWKFDAATPHATVFLEQLNAPKEKVAPPPVVYKKTFCVCCGVGGDFGGVTRCTAHRSGRPAWSRHCGRCGTAFVADKTRSSGSQLTCVSCRETPAGGAS